MRETIYKIHNLQSTNTAAVSDAIEFLNLLIHGTKQPIVELTRYNEIKLEWNRDYLRLVVIFEGDGTYSFVADNSKLPDRTTGNSIPVNHLSQRIIPYINPRRVIGIDELTKEDIDRMLGIAQLQSQQDHDLS